MSLFKRIFGGLGSSGNQARAKTLAIPEESHPAATISDGLLLVDRPRFMGRAELSPNEQWAASFGNQGGSPWVVLCDIKHKRVQHTSDTFVSPMAVAVSDAGMLLVHDALARGELSGAVTVLRPDGEEIFRRTYQANIFSVAISPCGGIACAQTANSKADGNLFEAFDLKMGQVLFSVHPETQWTTAYRFEVSDGVLLKLHVGSKPSGPYAYSATGEFLDKARQIQAGLDGGPPGFRISCAETVFGDPSSSSSEKARAIQTLDDVAQELRTSSPDWAAKALRAKGEALEKVGCSIEAIVAYEAALALDPKAGVKKRLSALQKAAK